MRGKGAAARAAAGGLSVTLAGLHPVETLQRLHRPIGADGETRLLQGHHGVALRAEASGHGRQAGQLMKFDELGRAGFLRDELQNGAVAWPFARAGDQERAALMIDDEA